jgi:hypothetical protein
MDPKTRKSCAREGSSADLPIELCDDDDDDDDDDDNYASHDNNATSEHDENRESSLKQRRSTEPLSAAATTQLGLDDPNHNETTSQPPRKRPMTMMPNQNQNHNLVPIKIFHQANGTTAGAYVDVVVDQNDEFVLTTRLYDDTARIVTRSKQDHSLAHPFQLPRRFRSSTR